jgi:WD40 repeat protein
MDTSFRLARTILFYTCIVLSVLGIVVCSILIVKAPSSSSPEIFIQPGGALLISSVVWSPDGKKLVSGNSDGTLSVWRADTGELVKTLTGHSKGTSSVTWNPDGQTFASGSWDGTVKIWSLERDRELSYVYAESDGVRSGVSSVVWNPDGSTLAFANSDGSLTLYDPSSRSFRTLNSKAYFNDGIFSVVWNPDGKTLASGSEDGKVTIWDVSTGRVLKTLIGHSARVSTLSWNPDRKTLASGSWDGRAKIWNVEKGQEERSLNLKTSLSLWDAGTQNRHKFLSQRGEENTPEHVFSVAWSPSGKMLAVASGNRVSLWDANENLALEVLADSEATVSWSPDGKMLATASIDSSITVCEADTGQVVISLSRFPGNEWLSTKPESLFFVGSSKGANYAAIRFDHRISPVYPLAYYRSKLKRDELATVSSEPTPKINPEPIRYAWDHFRNKGLWFGGITLLYVMTVSVILILAQQAEPVRVTRRFFSRAGFERVELHGKACLILYVKGIPRASVIVPERGQLIFPDLSGRFEKIYVINRGEFVSTQDIQSLRTKHRKPVIPLLYATITRALSENICKQTLCELEEPYLARTDPYDESRPITDPTWFYGRHDLLERLPVALRQGQHAGLFGLRKVGKTSFIHQLRVRLTLTPTIWIDCQGHPAIAEQLFSVILDQLHTELRIRGIAAPASTPIESFNEFRPQFLSLYDLWVRSGGNGPIIIILDEADKLFPDRRISQSDRILEVWISLFRVLRSLAQERGCLSVLATAYRPDVNRQNVLSPSLGENPMFMSFQEYFLGSLGRHETEEMIREIGAWKDINWSSEALANTYDLCGGHPLVTRFFASEACAQGTLKFVDANRVKETAKTICSGFHKHRIGRYYKESVWDCLQDEERSTLGEVAIGGLKLGSADAVTNLEQFGVIRVANGTYEVSAQLFRSWLARG